MDVVIAMLCYLLVVLPYSILLFVICYSSNNKEFNECIHEEYLFLFFVEAMSLFLTAEDVGLKGITMPLDGTHVVNVEFARDTSLYLNGQITNMQKMYNANFLYDLRCINQSEYIIGFLVTSNFTPQWSPYLDFQWQLC